VCMSRRVTCLWKGTVCHFCYYRLDIFSSSLFSFFFIISCQIGFGEKRRFFKSLFPVYVGGTGGVLHSMFLYFDLVSATARIGFL
jgi:hypothetical protein